MILMETHVGNLWYTADEIDAMKARARLVCLEIRPQVEKLTNGYATEDESTRGLESRACRYRQGRRIWLVRHIVEAQQTQKGQEDKNAYQLACLSYQYTHCAAVVALEEAARDVVRANLPKRLVHWADETDVPTVHHKRARTVQ